jgi:hypothetical protein
MAVKISDELAAQFFDDYSGIAYICEAEVLHAHTFLLKTQAIVIWVRSCSSTGNLGIVIGLLQKKSMLELKLLNFRPES